MLVDTKNDRKANAFGLQWHLTHACDMHCAHCYDRSKISPLRLEQGKAIVDDLLAFCSVRGVSPWITLSGGNPFLYPKLLELWQYIADRKLPAGLLGNPVSRQELEELIAIRKPDYFQISLEGLEAHNDPIRGTGSFQRALEFLELLREKEIHSMVMLTLTDANVDQVIPLGEVLRGKTGKYTFNRLSQVGQGAALQLPSPDRYGTFMVEYLAAAQKNPTMSFKDNLFNIFRHELGMKLHGGCTGYGCGAAFNFLAVLPNGDAHACRKFPSLVGNVITEPLDVVYESEAAARYRRGCSACDGCAIRAKCGGCLAVTAGQGLDPFTVRDPFCFMFD